MIFRMRAWHSISAIEELAIAFECDAQDQHEHLPKLMPVDPITWQIPTKEKQHA